MKSEENEKNSYFKDNFYENSLKEDSFINNNFKNNFYQQKKKLKIIFKRILSMNADDEQISFIKTSVPSTNIDLNSSVESINYRNPVFPSAFLRLRAPGGLREM